MKTHEKSRKEAGAIGQIHHEFLTVDVGKVVLPDVVMTFVQAPSEQFALTVHNQQPCKMPLCGNRLPVCHWNWWISHRDLSEAIPSNSCILLAMAEEAAVSVKDRPRPVLSPGNEIKISAFSLAQSSYQCFYLSKGGYCEITLMGIVLLSGPTACNTRRLDSGFTKRPEMIDEVKVSWRSILGDGIATNPIRFFLSRSITGRGYLDIWKRIHLQ